MLKSTLIIALLFSFLLILTNCKSELTEKYKVSKTLTKTFETAFILIPNDEAEIVIAASTFRTLFDGLKDGFPDGHLDLQYVTYSVNSSPNNTAAGAAIDLAVDNIPMFDNAVLDLGSSGEQFLTQQLKAEGADRLRSAILVAVYADHPADIRFRLSAQATSAGVLQANVTIGMRFSFTYSSCEELLVGMGDQPCLQ
ncbi:MAG: hypothetical protein ABIV51_03780 [Saprospiraceae bacterium]